MEAEAGGASSTAGGSTGVANAGSTAGATGAENAGSAAGGASAGASGAGPVPCGLQCPAPFLELELAVMSSAGIGEVSGVQAVLLGSVTVPLNCSGFAGSTYCFPTEGAAEGIYLLEANAPGFQTAVISVTVTFTPAQGCGCASASANPSLVTLNPLR